MSAEHAQREPTMEEILASIRRIISEEDKPSEPGADVLELQPPPPPQAAEVKASPPPAPAAAPRPAPPPEPKPEPVVAKAPPPPVEVFDEPEEEEVASPPPPPQRPLAEDLMIVEKTPDLPPPAPAPVAVAPQPAPKAEWTPPVRDTLVSEPVASRTAGELGKLMGSMFVSTGNTLDDVVREMLKPLLKEWLDANLQQLVESEVAKEIDRIRRMAR
jgi:cell pole-organizing protein PopZ